MNLLQASGLSIPEGSTVFAPNNEAFSSKELKQRTGLAAADLLKPENKQKLIDVSRHCCCAVLRTALQLQNVFEYTTLPTLRLRLTMD